MEEKTKINCETDVKKGEMLTLSEFRREAGIPLVLARKMILWGEVEAVRAYDGTLRIASDEVCRVKNLLSNPREKVRYFFSGPWARSNHWSIGR